MKHITKISKLKAQSFKKENSKHHSIKTLILFLFLIKALFRIKNFLIEYQCWNTIKIKLKSDGSTQRSNLIRQSSLSRMEPTCNPLISTTSAKQTARSLQTLKLAGFKPLYRFVSFLRVVWNGKAIFTCRGKRNMLFLGSPQRI